MKTVSTANNSTDEMIVDCRWRTLLYVGACACVYVFLLIPIQGIVFIISPPPDTVVGFFDLFQRNVFLGLVHLDFLLTIDYILVLFVYFVLFIVLSEKAKSLSLIAIVLGCLSITLYIVSREATFSMVGLSNEYFHAETTEDRIAIIEVGKTLLTIYNGSSFDISYVLAGVSMILFSLAMQRHGAFGRIIPITGIVMSILMLVPPTIGKVGIVISMISLLPSLVWMFLMARWMIRVARSLSKSS